MSRFQCSFESHALHLPTTITIVLPYPVFDTSSLNESLEDFYEPRAKFRTLNLFYGAFADANSWSLWTLGGSLCRTTCDLEDNLYEMNTKVRDLAIANSILLTYEEGPGGHHGNFGSGLWNGLIALLSRDRS